MSIESRSDLSGMQAVGRAVGETLRSSPATWRTRP